MKKKLKEILDTLIEKRGIDCLHDSQTWRYVTDFAPKADISDKNIIVLALKSKAFDTFFNSDDFDHVFQKLKQETHWDDQTMFEVINSFADVLGIDNNKFLVKKNKNNTISNQNNNTVSNQTIQQIKSSVAPSNNTVASFSPSSPKNKSKNKFLSCYSFIGNLLNAIATLFLLKLLYGFAFITVLNSIPICLLCSLLYYTSHFDKTQFEGIRDKSLSWRILFWLGTLVVNCLVSVISISLGHLSDSYSPMLLFLTYFYLAFIYIIYFVYLSKIEHLSYSDYVVRSLLMYLIPATILIIFPQGIILEKEHKFDLGIYFLIQLAVSFVLSLVSSGVVTREVDNSGFVVMVILGIALMFLLSISLCLWPSTLWTIIVGIIVGIIYIFFVIRMIF